MMGDQRWDAIVVGAGLGGLTAAAYLTAGGKRTLLLEQYDVASKRLARKQRPATAAALR